MSNDEHKISLVNYDRFYFGQSTVDNSYRNYCNTQYETILPLKQSDNKHFTQPVTTPPIKKPSCQSYDVDNKIINNNGSSHNTHKPFMGANCVPMNLITNTGLDLSHSIRKETIDQYYNNEHLIHNNNNFYTSSPSSFTTSPSIDVENDDKDDITECITSPVSIPSHIQNPLLNDTRKTNQSAFTNMELTAGSITSRFPLHYQQLYANNVPLYGAPVMFSDAIHAANASYMARLPLHAALSPDDTYLKAIQAACSIYSPSPLAPPIPPSLSTPSTVKTAEVHNRTHSSMSTPTPPTQHIGISKSSHHQSHQYPLNIVNNLAETEQQQQKKKDYLTPPLNSQTPLRTNATNNSTGTYLNNKVNERLAGAGSTKDSHFKVPNGKEGSLKHRILRQPNNNDGPVESAKTSVMRTYSTSSSFKKGSYTELANGTLRRVEDIRTEDFIQSAERSTHLQLAESTVVKINTSLPSAAVITFSYDRHRAKVDIEISLDHPFFVYGQGWASCNPEMSMKIFGLKCQRLQVGDICISLIKREQPPQAIASVPYTNQSNSLSLLNDVASYQVRPSLTASIANAALLKSPAIPTISPTTKIPYAHSFSIPAPQPTHRLHHQQEQHHHHHHHHHHHQVQQQAYAEMNKLISSYAYTKSLSQQAHDQLKEVAMDSTILQNLTPEMVTAVYQNQIFQLTQQQHHQEHSLQAELKTNQQRVPNSTYNATTSSNTSLSPLISHLENNHIQQQPPQTQPLDVTMSRKRRWSAPENMLDDEEPDIQDLHNGLSPNTART